jgi:hypothetical protein
LLRYIINKINLLTSKVFKYKKISVSQQLMQFIHINISILICISFILILIHHTDMNIRSSGCHRSYFIIIIWFISMTFISRFSISIIIINYLELNLRCRSYRYQIRFYILNRFISSQISFFNRLFVLVHLIIS